MGWVVWRQHRGTAAGILLAYAIAGLAVWLLGHQMHLTYGPLAHCHPLTATVCQLDIRQFQTVSASALPLLLQALPPLIGAFAGAPLLASEFESGTFRYAWTQGFGPLRWVAGQLVPLAALVVVGGLALSQLVSWAYYPAIEQLHLQSPLTPLYFDLRGVDLAAWTLLAFALGALAGMVLRRAIPAVLVAIAVWVGAAIATARYLRPYYWAPLHNTTGHLSQSAWLLAREWMRHGAPATLAALNRALQPIGAHLSTPLGPMKQATSYIEPYLIHHGFQLCAIYQPASRFWSFQTIEGIWLLSLSLILLAAVLWLVHRRGG